MTTLLSHYFEKDTDTEQLAAALSDWVTLLAGYPQPVINQAALDHLREQPDRRPTPGHILRRCNRIVAQARPRAMALPPPSRGPRSEGEKARISELMARAGFAPRRAPVGEGDAA